LIVQKWMQTLAGLVVSGAAWAVEEPVRANVTSTTWEIYGAFALTVVVGGLWLVWHQSKEKDRERRRASRRQATH
jgi:hypothetical protein